MQEEQWIEGNNGFFGRGISQGYAMFVSRFEWDFFGTLTFRWKASISAIRRAVERHFGRVCPTLAFWVVERGKVDGKDHVHVLYNFDGSNLLRVRKSLIEKDWSGRNGIAEVKEYDSRLDGFAYICKTLDTNPSDYDLWVYENDTLTDLGRDETQRLESGTKNGRGLIGGETDVRPERPC